MNMSPSPHSVADYQFSWRSDSDVSVALRRLLCGVLIVEGVHSYTFGRSDIALAESFARSNLRSVSKSSHSYEELAGKDFREC